MKYKITAEDLNGIKLIECLVFNDKRGSFLESYNKRGLAEIGINEEFVQDNQSISAKEVIRGLHFQYNKAQGKLLRVISGRAIFREVDIRINSKHFGEYREYELSDKNNLMLWVPPGFANGFSAESDSVIIHYKCTEYWDSASEVTILYDDRAIGINWNIKNPIISDKDKDGISISEWKNKNIHI